MGTEETTIQPNEKEMFGRYKKTVEQAIARVPVKNGVVDIDSIWIEASIPYELLRKILARGDLELPGNVERINSISRARMGERSGSRREKKRRRRHKVWH
ncbi:hypothetical protein JW848_02665 [Candidatus Bipolaricaulota bacterium]|nr:hypothetical protein [Candidatus Bipolaricaulota bacterium]